MPWYNNALDVLHLLGSSTATQSPFANTMKDIVPPMEFGCPILHINNKFDEETKAFVRSQGMTETADATSNHFVGKPSFEQFKALMKTGVTEAKFLPTGHTGMNGYLAYIYAWRGVALFQSVLNQENAATCFFTAAKADLVEYSTTVVSLASMLYCCLSILLRMAMMTASR